MQAVDNQAVIGFKKVPALMWALPMGALSLLAVACPVEGERIHVADVTVHNRTEGVLTLWFELGDNTIAAGRVAAGGVSTPAIPQEILRVEPGEYCTKADLVARAPDGAEYDELSGPICRPTEWVIAPAASGS